MAGKVLAESGDAILDEGGFFLLQEDGAGAVEYTLTCAAGTFAMTGGALGLGVSRLLTCGAGEFALTGGDLTSTVVGPPAAPSGLTATTASSSQIDLAWTDNAEDAEGSNEVQTITYSATPTTGTYTLTYDGETTDPINHGDDAAAIQAALEATAAFEVGDVAVSKSGNVITLTYQGGLAAMSLPEITASGSLKRDADSITVTVTQSGIADVGSTPSINTTTSAVSPVASTPSISTTQNSNGIDTPQIDTVTFSAPANAGTMLLDGQPLGWNTDANGLTISGATASGTPNSGTIAITWSDFDAHTPVSIAADSLLSVEGVHQVDTITFDLSPAGGSMTINSDPLAWNANASTISISGAVLSGAPSSGTITVTWDDYETHTPPSVDGTSLLSTVGRVHIFTVELGDGPTEGTFTLDKGGSYTSEISYNASALSLEGLIEGVSGGYPCSVTGSDGGPWTITSDPKIAAPTWTASEASLLLSAVDITVTTTAEGSPRSWDDLGTEVHRSTDGVSYSLLVDLGANMESWPDETCSPSTLYYYKSRAYNAGGYSAFSSAASDTTDAASGGQRAAYGQFSYSYRVGM